MSCVRANELVLQLRSVAAELEDIATEGQRPEYTAPVERLTEVCNQFAEVWSGSVIGYHTRVYYRNFQPPPSGAHFSAEWGIHPATMGGSRGDWVEYSQAEVVAAIEAAAGQQDLGPATDFARRARVVFDQGQAEVVSMLTSATRYQDDQLIHDAIDAARDMQPFTQYTAVQAMMPSTVHSRDMRAISEGAQGAPHMAYLGHLIELRDIGDRCHAMALLAGRMANHLERTTTMQPDGTTHTGGRVFIGHGGSLQWRVLKDFIRDDLGLEFEEFNRVPTAGVATIDRLTEMLANASFAFIVMTAEDEHADGSHHARENVVHEAGLFQGRLGFHRAIILLEEDCDEYSNVHGLGQIRFPSGHIEVKFEEVRQVLRREGLVT